MTFAPHSVSEFAWQMPREIYDQIVATGALDGERVELVHGVITNMSPEYAPHAEAIEWLDEQLTEQLQKRASVRVQHPLAVGPLHEPEPDLAMVERRRWRDVHPSTAFLVVEVAMSSLRYDREVKEPIYAAAGIPEYWIVNLNEKVVEVYRQPAVDGYRDVQIIRAGGTISPLAFPDVEVDVAELFGGSSG